MINLYSISVIPEYERKSLELKRERLTKIGDVKKAILDKRVNLITKEALNHSYHIENRDKEARRVGRTEEPERKYHENLSFLTDAWQYIKDIDLTSLSFEHLIDINKILEPNSMGIRSGAIRITDSQVSRPNPASLLNGLDEAFDVANSLKSSLDSALFLSLRLLYLHPFEDGNGRTIRLYANAILNQSSYPSIVIPESERNFYFLNLENAMISQKNRTSSGNPNLEQVISESESVFYRYLVSKVNTGFDELIDSLNKNKKTQIYLDFTGKSDKGTYISLVKRIRQLAKTRGLDVTATFKNNQSPNGRHIEVTGDISSQNLQTILDSTSNLKSYKVYED